MNFAARHQHGPAVAVPPPPHRPERLTTEQKLNRRNSLWLRATEHGIYDPAIGRDRQHRTTELADLFNVSIRTVELGIASALRIRTEIATFTRRVERGE